MKTSEVQWSGANATFVMRKNRRTNGDGLARCLD